MVAQGALIKMKLSVCEKAVVAIFSALALTGILFAGDSLADDNKGQSRFITLGTNSGPVPNPARAEASNVLVSGKNTIVVDAGDGVAWQLAKAGISLGKVDTVFLSHLHFDHTGGLFALLSQRFQINYPGVVTIYGPQGTRQTIAGLVKAMDPVYEDSGWILSKIQDSPAEKVKVVEVTDGSKITIEDIQVTVSKNTHFILAEKEGDSKVRGLSFRFDLPDRSIVYTGDTGPSEDVIRLARGADVLVTEIMDADVSLEKAKAVAAQEDPNLLQQVAITFATGALKAHFEQQHLSPEEVGLMAKRANVKSLVITHNALPDELIDGARDRVARNYGGPVAFASDLQVF
jgi:ribonuclease BN (tRNA processing enzyme)